MSEADAAVEFLLNNLKNLLLYHSDLITDSLKPIESLDSNLRIFKGFLKDSQRKRIKDGPTKHLVRNICDVVYDVEDVIDAFVTQAVEKSTSSLFKFRKLSVSLHQIGEMVEEVIKNIDRVRFDFTNLSAPDEDKYAEPEGQARPPRQKDVVGFADVTDELINRLTTQTTYFDVVCLIGMFGLGKSTLAWKIFNDPAVLYEFPVRIWLSISQEFSDKDVFLAILAEFTTITADIRGEDENKLALVVASYLESRSFLIVFDDVWSFADWDRIRHCLPTKNVKGKVLITSRIEGVGKYACSPRPPTVLRFFNQEESWELLRLEALRKLECPPELEIVGQLIARYCEGLPLAVVIIGGILATKYKEYLDVSHTRKVWEKVSTQVSMYLNADPTDRMNNFISLSYDKLPYHLRSCFLYLGMFPEDYEIPVSKLILMWIGEGFIQQSNDCSLEETGEKYLEDLINRNLVRIKKTKPSGVVKTCCIHETFRNFCRKEAGYENENFLQEIEFKNGVFSHPFSDMHGYRRLSIHSHILIFINQQPFGPRVRSFVCFSKDDFVLPLESIPGFSKAFKLLRVLDVKPIRFPVVNIDFFLLVHLRYVVISVDLPTLPSRFSQLWNLETLIVNTTKRTLEVEADIWKLIQLRHFKTNVSASLQKPSKDSKYGAELQTLGTISVGSCTTELFQHARNVKKLGIRGQLSLLLEGKKGSFNSVGRMKNLENLKLINDLYPLPPSERQLNGLPQAYQFPPRLRSLTLRATFLDWSNMTTLGLLANLEVLKLKDKAFMGDTWEAVDGGFRRLEFLYIEETNLAVWTASSHHYPRLRGLVLKNCEKLLKIPIGLADVATFQMLNLYGCRSAVSSAKEIQVAKKAEVAFKLSIFLQNE